MLKRKIIRFDKRAAKEISKFPEVVQAKAKALVQILIRDGRLIEPFGKKIGAKLFEMRIKHDGQWRVLFAYVTNNYVIILSAFQKKTQKTPQKEIKSALSRLKEYEL